MKISFQVDGITQLSRNLRVSASDLKELKPFFVEAVDIIKERSDELFENNGSNLEK
jgi:hypothetical protein